MVVVAQFFRALGVSVFVICCCLTAIDSSFGDDPGGISIAVCGGQSCKSGCAASITGWCPAATTGCSQSTDTNCANCRCTQPKRHEPCDCKL
jgi:hypothetical protein